MARLSHELRVVRIGDTATPKAVSDLLSERDRALFARFPGASIDFPLLAYLESDDRAVSYLRCIPDQVTVQGRTYSWAWTGDNYTHPGYRGQGLSTHLQQAATDYLHSRGIGRGSVFSTDVTLHIFEKLGFVLAGHVPRRLLVRSLRPIVDAHLSSHAARLVGHVLARPISAVLAGAISVWNGPDDRRFSCSTSHGFPKADIQSLIDVIAAGRRVHFAPDADVVERKLILAQRAGKHTVHLLHDARSARCVAYFIVRQRRQDAPLAGRYRNFDLMSLVDFGLIPGDNGAAAAIVRHLVRMFVRSRNDVLELVSTDPAVNRAAGRLGFRAVGRGMSFNWSTPPGWDWPAELRHASEWPLTAFAGDAFSY